MTVTFRMYTRCLAVLLASVLLTTTSACSDDDDMATSPPSTISSTSTTTPADSPTSIDLPPKKIAPVPDHGEPPADGTHAAFVRSVDSDAGTVTIDIVQWLSGEAANVAYAKATGDDSGAPGDFFIVNASDAVRTIPVHSPAVTVAWDDNGPRQRGISLQELPGYLAARNDPDAPFWVTVTDEAVVRIDEQYRP